MKPAFGRRLVIAGAMAAAVALLIGVVAYALGVNDGFGRRTQTNFVPFMFLLGSVLLLAAGAMLACHAPEAANKVPGLGGILALSLVASFFVLLYFRHVLPLVFFPADILGWSESPFLDFIIRFRAGEPLFTPVQDGNAFAYPPLAALLTYGAVKIAGMETSVPAMRVAQQVFLLVGAVFVAGSVRTLLRHLRPETRYANWWMWFWVPILFLVATDENVNPWVVTLHTDALALALHCFAFWLLVQHATSRNDRWLIAMLVVPSVGYLLKQNALAWAGIYCFYLVLREQPRIRQILGFAVAVFSVWGLTLVGCYWLWGEVYFQWTFQTLGNLHVSLAKIVEDLGKAGWYFLLGLLGAVIVMRGEHFRFLLPIWSSWLMLWIFLHYSMAAAHRTAHIGPACVIGMGWFALALAYRWPEASGAESKEARLETWWRMVALSAAVAVLCATLGFVRLDRVDTAGARQYVNQLEQEFAGLPRESVLLDIGSWVYLRDSVVMKDRSGPINVLSGTELASDSPGMVDRIRDKRYRKILVRLRGGTDLVYPREIQESLRRHYRETGVIRPPVAPAGWPFQSTLREIVVLEPSN